MPPLSIPRRGHQPSILGPRNFRWTKLWPVAFLFTLFFAPAAAAQGDKRSVFAADAVGIDELILHVYSPKRLTGAEVEDTYKPYFLGAANEFYDALEGRARIRRIYFYNGVPQGDKFGDVKILPGEGDKANAPPFGFFFHKYNPVLMEAGNVERQLDFNGKLLTPAQQQRVLVHELGHYIWGLGDSYGGMLLDSGGRVLPLPWGGSSSYMWRDEDLRSRARNINVPPNNSARIFYDVSGANLAPSTGDFSYYGQDVSMMDTQGSEFATRLSSIGAFDLDLRLNRYRIAESIWRSRPADASIKRYRAMTHHWYLHGKSEWEVIVETMNIGKLGRTVVWPAGWLGRSFPESEFVTKVDAFGPPSIRWIAPERCLPNISPVPAEFVVVGGDLFALCLDASGSMSGTPLDLARRSASLLIDTLDSELSSAAVVSFDTSATVRASLRTLLDPNDRAAVSRAVSSITAGGGTAIGSGLIRARDELLGGGSAASVKACVLLSDGQNNAGPDPLSVLPSLVANDIALYTVALGGEADRALLARLATETRGQAFVANSAADLPRIANDIVATSGAYGSLGKDAEFSLGPGQTYRQSFPVGRGTQKAIFSVISDGNFIGARLLDPRGKDVSAGSNNVRVKGSGPQRVFDVVDPMPGPWRLVVDRKNFPRVGPWSGAPNAALPAATGGNAGLAIDELEGRQGFAGGLSVRVRIADVPANQIRVTLVSPQGERVLLYDRARFGAGLDLTFGAAAGQVRPLQSLEVLNGKPLDGTWRLEVENLGTTATGRLVFWSLESSGQVATTATQRVATSGVVQDPRISLNVFSSARSLVFPQPLILEATVSEGAPVAGAVVQALVSMPNGSQTRVVLLDDGDQTQGDFRAGDGVYSAAFSDYSGGNGVYDIRVTASTTAKSRITEPLAIPATADRSAQRASLFSRTSVLQVVVSGVPPQYSSAVTLDRLTLRDRTRRSADRFRVQGSFTMPQRTPQQLRDAFGSVTLGGVNDGVSASSFRRIGRSMRFIARDSRNRLYLNCFIGGSSKSKYEAGGKRRNLSIPQGGLIPVRFFLGASRSAAWVDGQLGALTSKRGDVYRYGVSTADPEFFVDLLSYNLPRGQTGGDSLRLVGRLRGAGAARYSPSEHALELDVGDVIITLPPGTLQPDGKRVFRAKNLELENGGSANVSFAEDRGVLTVAVRGADLGLARRQTAVRIAARIPQLPAASWLYSIDLQRSRNGSVLRF
jgi:subtilisin-like proprotein convertase family protein